MARTSRLLRALLSLLLLAGCRTSAPVPSSAPAPTEAPQAPVDPMLEGLKRLVQARPEDGAAIYTLASVHAGRGEHAEALRWLERLVELRWSFAPEDADFGALASTPGFRAVAERLARNEPRVSRGELAFSLPERDFIPEGITYDPVTETLFVGSIHRRKVVAVAKDGAVRDFLPEGQDGLFSVLGLKVDAARRHLWVASFVGKSGRGLKPEDEGRSALHQYDLRSGALVRKLVLDNTPAKHLLNDMALSAAGDVFVTDSEAGAVRVLRAGAEAFETLVADGSLIYPNGIALSEDGARLYVAHFGGLVMVDPASGQSTRVQAPPGTTLSGIDGLSTYGRSLIAVQNGVGRGRVSRLHLGAAPDRVERVEVLESGRLGDAPTTGTVVGEAFVFIANSHLRTLGADGALPPLERLRGPELLRVALGGK